MRAYVRFRLPSGELHDLGHGDLIGRVWTAALQIGDPFISEAHALVSMRGGALRLLGLRGRLCVAGQQAPEVLLSPGLDISLAPKTTLHVVDVHLPSTSLALEHPKLGRKLLSGVSSLVCDPRLSLIAGATLDARAVFWSDGASWFARMRDGQDWPLDPGASLEIDGRMLEIVAVTISADGEVTRVDPTSHEIAMNIVVRYDTVHIHRHGMPTVTLDGIIARIVSDLATANVPVGWQVLAIEIWGRDADPTVLRRNWDANMARLRKKLREGRVRTDLVRTDHRGNFEIYLGPADRIDDQT